MTRSEDATSPDRSAHDPSRPTADQTACDVDRFLAERLPTGWRGLGAVPASDADRFLTRWRQILLEERWLAPCWPVDYGGRGLPAEHLPVIRQRFAAHGAPTGVANDAQGIEMLGATLLALGDDALCTAFLPPTLDATIRWAEGFSEPDAGSDLAAVRTTASDDGEQFIVNGQKVWTSNADTANWMFLLARTDADSPKHTGLTFMLMSLDQPGVDRRPTRQISGGTEFSEVFLSDCVVEREHIVGEVDRGWSVALALLAHERAGISATIPVRLADECDRLRRLAAHAGHDQDPIARQRLTQAHIDATLVRLNGVRSGDSVVPGPAARSKVHWTERHQASALIGVDLLGADALSPSGRPPSSVFGPDDIGADPLDSASWVTTMLNSRAATIYAGTNEINRNVIGEHELGLPREPRHRSASSGE